MGDHRANDALVVERPEILQGPAAAGQDRDRRRVARGLARGPLDVPLEAPERADDARRGSFSLDAAGNQDDPGERPAPGQHVADVAPDRAARAGDHGDRRRAGRQGALAGRLEQPLLGQPRLEGLESKGQVTEPSRLDGLDIKLERALWLEQVDPTMDDDAQPGLRLERGPHPLVAEPDALELAALVLEAEVGVAGGGDRHSADLSLDPYVAQALVGAEVLADRAGDLGDAENPQPKRTGRERPR